MYTYEMYSNQNYALVTIPINLAQIRHFQIDTVPFDPASYAQVAITIGIEMTPAGSRILYIDLFGLLVKEANEEDWIPLLVDQESPRDKAIYHCRLRNAIKKILGGTDYDSLIDRIKNDFPSWMDHNEHYRRIS